MVLPVTQAAMSSSDHPHKAGRQKIRKDNFITTLFSSKSNSGNSSSQCHMVQSDTIMYHQGPFVNNTTVHSYRDNSERLQLFRDPKPLHLAAVDGHRICCDKREYLFDITSKGFTFTLFLVSLLVAGHLQGTSALSCDICDRSKCVNATDCPGGTVLDVCHCCMQCARGLNQTCGGTFGILGKCDRNLHCFIRYPDSLNQDGICKEIQKLDCNGTDCTTGFQQESLCPTDSYIATNNVDTDDVKKHHNSERLMHPPPPPLPLYMSSSPSLSSSSSSSTQAGSGHGKDDFGSTNTFNSGADESFHNDRGKDSLDHFGFDLTNDDEDEGEFIKNNYSEFHGNEIQSDSDFHGEISDDDYSDYRDESDYLLAEMPTSFCVCNFSFCQIPDCADDLSPVLMRKGTGVPGSCCDTYECKVVDVCQSIICPAIDETPCPSDSFRPPPRWSDDFCCKVQQECQCKPKEDCEPVQCPAGSEVQVISRGLALWTPGACCDKFRCVNESSLTCSYLGKELKNGETWDIDKCKTCVCRHGLNRCKDKSCKDPSCTWMVIPEGECCPVCRGCVSDSGELYNDADEWRENDCTTCVCKDGHAQCQAERCSVSCSNPMNVPGQCCPVCPEENVSMSRMCPGLDDCDLSCSLGLDQGEDGCFVCRCKEETCDMDCPHGFQTDVEGRQLCKCRNSPDHIKPPGCLMREEECPKKCEYGFQRSTDGCIKCKCNRCPQGACPKTCLHGYITNDEGCKLCKCKDAPSPSLTYPPMNAGQDGKPCMSRTGALHDDGESWNDSCRLCYCHSGVEMCSLISCSAPHCPNPVFRTGDCCPTCPGINITPPQGDKELCQSSQGRYYVEGETWDLDECTECICHGGAILCQTPSCPPVLCHHPVKPKGSCCASCRVDDIGMPQPASFPRHCKSSTGVYYKHGEVWRPTPCQSCACQNGQIHCFNQMCPPVNCNRTILKKGQCCPICAESRRLEVCVYDGTTYEEGEQWQGDNCTKCICVNGKFQCFPLPCPAIHCPVMVLRKGHCCPECYDMSKLQDLTKKKDGIKNATADTDSLSSSQQGKTVNGGSSVDANVIGFSVLGILVFILAFAVLLLVFFILRRRHQQNRSPRFRPRPKSTNLELQGHMPFIPQDNVSGDSGNGSGVDGSDPQLHSKSLNVEKQLLEKLCSGLVNERETRASNPYTEMVFGEQGKDSSRGSAHFLASVKT